MSVVQRQTAPPPPQTALIKSLWLSHIWLRSRFFPRPAALESAVGGGGAKSAPTPPHPHRPLDHPQNDSRLFTRPDLLGRKSSRPAAQLLATARYADSHRSDVNMLDLARYYFSVGGSAWFPLQQVLLCWPRFQLSKGTFFGTEM